MHAFNYFIDPDQSLSIFVGSELSDVESFNEDDMYGLGEAMSIVSVSSNDEEEQNNVSRCPIYIYIFFNMILGRKSCPNFQGH